MLHFEKGLEIMLSEASIVGTERTHMLQALHCVLGEDILSDVDMPPFNKSAMDGYACRKSDINLPLEVIEEIPAGKFPYKKIEKGQCSRIMTGAPVPEGADIVVMKENTIIDKDDNVVCTGSSNSTNICYTGEDVKCGDLVLPNGTLLQPSHVAILAATGNTHPLVYKKPSVAVISTGNELVEPNQLPGKSQIRNSNGYQVIAQLQQMGLTSSYMGIVKDNEDDLTHLLNQALNDNDILIISGGVSVGDYDFVPKALTNIGVEILFHGIKSKPGKHLLFGKKGTRFVVGLPGNPVSSFIQMEVLIKPFLYKIMGVSTQPVMLQLPLQNDYKRKKSDVLSFVPVAFTEHGSVDPLEYHGSAHIHAYSKAQGIMELPVGINEFKEGEIVNVRPL